MQNHIGKRTGLDFSKHEMLTTIAEGLRIDHLKKPDTLIDKSLYLKVGFIRLSLIVAL